MPRDPKPVFPVLPLRSAAIFPGSMLPVLLVRKDSVKSLDAAYDKFDEPQVLVCLQKDAEIEAPGPGDLHTTGVLCRILSRTSLPGGMNKVLLEGLFPVDVDQWLDDEFLSAAISPHDLKSGNTSNIQNVRQEIQGLFHEYANIRDDIPDELIQSLSDQKDPVMFLYTLGPFLNGDLDVMQQLLSSNSIDELIHLVKEMLTQSLEIHRVNHRIEQQVRHKVQKNQREYLIHEQIRMLSEEIEDNPAAGSPEVLQLAKDLKKHPVPEEARDKINEELKRLRHLQPGSPEYSVVRNYLDTFLAIPFGQFTTDFTNLNQVKSKLNQNHFGLDKVKERILEHVAVLQRAPREHAPVLCLVGPPGVGKTSLAKSIAEALGRKFARIALGGVRDESEIRGHRRTYIGAMPGRIVESLRRSKSMNPLILLDEIDKMTSDFRGDPSSALLEVLDPEQNGAFVDHYLEAGIDLSRVLFFTTANVETNIPDVLRDRMEIIRLSGYHMHEKVSIGTDYLVPRVMKRNGIQGEKELELSPEIVEKIAQGWTREAGVRRLEQLLDQVARKRTLELVTKKKFSPAIGEKILPKWLGPAPFKSSQLPETVRPGIVSGLAWTRVGGEVLKIECTLTQGRGRILLTGTLGEVMKESAHIALTLVKERAEALKIDYKLFNKTDIHLHVPEGAIPKDGPSAGIAMTLALISAFTRRPIKPAYTFTGEISLSGDTHGIGGLVEKSLGALNAGATHLFIPEDNRKDVPELASQVRKGLKIKHLSHIDQAIKQVFRGAKPVED